MKFFTKVLAAVVIATAAVMPAQAQFKWGVKAGVAVNSLKLNTETFNSDNRAGFTGGLMAEFTVPIINVGFDASVLYANRSIELDNEKFNRSYIDIPINFKYKIGLPIIGKFVAPFLTTGPDFSFLVSKKTMKDAVSNRKFDVAWTVGAGIQFVNHVQIGATYGFGLKSASSSEQHLFKGKNRCWTITAAYLF
ncbi:MAG: PorT family protein [Muribaculaceae bacterium]|nr:PorT family protein [Muribaculaceae bacterium]